MIYSNQDKKVLFVFDIWFDPIIFATDFNNGVPLQAEIIPFEPGRVMPTREQSYLLFIPHCGIS